MSVIKSFFEQIYEDSKLDKSYFDDIRRFVFFGYFIVEPFMPLIIKEVRKCKKKDS